MRSFILPYRFRLRFLFNLNLYEESEIVDLVDFGGVAFSVESVTREYEFNVCSFRLCVWNCVKVSRV